MKRDMDLVRNILLAFEQIEGAQVSVSELKLKGLQWGNQNVGPHIVLVHDAGLITKAGDRGPALEKTYRHTWSGYEFLEAIRDPEVWAKTQEGAEKVGSSSIDVMDAIARGYIQAKLKEQIGIDADI